MPLLKKSDAFMKNSLKNPSRIKQQVASQFNRAALTYDGAARVQQYSARELVKQFDLLQTTPTNEAHISGSWLDLGCGTGFAVPSLLKLGVKDVVGADLSPIMCEMSSNNLSHLPFTSLTCDAENLPFKDSSFDGIFSNLMVQWSENLDCLFSEAHRVMKPGSLFAFSTLGPKTMHELKSAWAKVDPFVHVNTFSDPSFLVNNCEKFFTIESFHRQEYIQQHSGLSPLLKELKAIGATNVNSGRRPGLGGRERLKQLEQAYQQLCGDSLSLTYDLIWVVARSTSPSLRTV